MINSDFDTIIMNDNNYQGKKKSKLKIFAIIFILIILVAGVILGYFYYSKYKASIPKIKFFEYIGDSNISKITDTTLLQAINDKISNSSCVIKNELMFKLQDESIKLPTIKLDYKKNSNNAHSAELILNKSEEEELIKFSLLFDNENIGIKCDDIVIKYVGSKITNLGEVGKNIYLSNTMEEVNIDFSSEPKIEIPNEIIFEKYKNILNEKLTEDKFTIENNVLLTYNNSSLETTLYELNLSKEDVLQILTELKNQIINDDELFNCFITGKQTTEDQIINVIKFIEGYKIDVTLQEAKEYIEEIFLKYYDEIVILENFNFKFNIYVNGQKVVKKSINCGEYIQIEIENEEKSENENFAKVTLIEKNENDEKNGISFYINRLDNNVSTIINSELSIIENMEINNKFVTNITLEGNQSSTNLNNKIVFAFNNTDSQGEAVLNSTIEFGIEEEIETLNADNCLFIDELDIETLNQVIEQIETKAEEVAGLKIQEFLKKDLIVENQNTLDGFVNMDNQSNQDEKQKAQDKLIAAISKEMHVAEEENREYALTDLQNLHIEGSTISVMVGENMAIVAIDGYTFYIDPNFVLTTE